MEKLQRSSSEKRSAPDGVRYTEQEFLDWFGAETGAWHWAHSPDAPAAAPAAAAAAAAAAGRPGTVEKRLADDGVLYSRADFLDFYGAEAGAVRWRLRDPASQDAARRCSAPTANLAELNADHGRTAALKPPDCALLDFVLAAQLLPWSRVVVASTTYTAWFVDYETGTASLVDATTEPPVFLDDVPLDTLTRVDPSTTVTRDDCLSADGPTLVLNKLGLEPALLQWWGAGACRYTDRHACEQGVSLEGNATFQRLACALLLFFRISVALPLAQQKRFKEAVAWRRGARGFFLYDYRNDERGCGYLLLYNLSSFPSTKYALRKLQQACLLKMLDIMSTLDGHFAALRHGAAPAAAACWRSIADIETVDKGMRAEQHGMPAIPDEAAYKRITGAAEAPWHRELALMVALETAGELLDPSFQSRVVAAVAPFLDHVTVMAGPPKTNNRMWGKLEHEHCRMPGYPKSYWNKDISRACVVVPENNVAPLFRLLCAAFGEPVGVKNGFTMDRAAVRERFGYRSLMVFFRVAAPRDVTFSVVAQRMEDKAKRDVWVSFFYFFPRCSCVVCGL